MDWQIDKPANHDTLDMLMFKTKRNAKAVEQKKLFMAFEASEIKLSPDQLSRPHTGGQKRSNAK
jgi:hypothetical protein